jgi:hypothetical protein
MKSEPPEYPSNFSNTETAQLNALLHQAQSMASEYTGDYTAPWLLSPIHEPTWKITQGNQTRYINDEPIDFFEYQWSTKLNDGSNLTDPINRHLLQASQKLAFLIRELHGGPSTFVSFRSFLWSLNFFIRWMFVHSDELDPRQHFFKRLTQDHIIDLVSEYSQGGTVFALRYPQKFLERIIPLAMNRPATADELARPLDLSLETCIAVSNWLVLNGHMKRRRRSLKNDLTIRGTAIADIIGCDNRCLRGRGKWTAFKVQFDTALIACKTNNTLMIGCKSACEMPSHRNIELEECKSSLVSQNSIIKYYCDLTYIIRLHSHLPEVCPNPRLFDLSAILNWITKLSAPPEHTPWVPLNIALKYTSEAIKWVHLYGDDLVTVYLKTYQEMMSRGLITSGDSRALEKNSKPSTKKANKLLRTLRKKLIETIDVPKSLKPLNIGGLYFYSNLNGNKSFQKLRDNPSLTDAICILIGAITITITALKPMRESEFRELRTNCLHHVEGDGYWLSHKLRKKNLDDLLPEDARPIPAIAAKAIQQLGRLTSGLKEILEITDEWLLSSLVTIPRFRDFSPTVAIPDAPRLRQVLDTFCDYVALPPDEQGRRWYIRIHDMRKSFLIVFFWTYRYANLDVARWIAGHSDASHIYSYIQANFPGEELPSLEAEYACQVLHEYEESGNVTHISNVEALYSSACKKFNVSNISWIEDSILKDWLELQFESRQFEIAPISIINPDGGTEVEIAFRVLETDFEDQFS